MLRDGESRHGIRIYYMANKPLNNTGERPLFASGGMILTAWIICLLGCIARPAFSGGAPEAARDTIVNQIGRAHV